MRWFGREETKDIGNFMERSIMLEEPTYAPVQPRGKSYRGLEMIYQNLEHLADRSKSKYNITAEARHARVLCDLWKKNFDKIETYIRD
jgi:hypothetical protein